MPTKLGLVPHLHSMHSRRRTLAPRTRRRRRPVPIKFTLLKLSAGLGCTGPAMRFLPFRNIQKDGRRGTLMTIPWCSSTTALQAPQDGHRRLCQMTLMRTVVRVVHSRLP